MTYIEWNSAIAAYFFNQAAAGKSIPLCVTRDTLAEISGLDPEQAVQDFVRAVKDGPQWTQVPGCSRIGSKARNCLFPDPNWHRRGPRSTEKRDLSDHDRWEKFAAAAAGAPPYLAYLACFVLAWTERPSDYNGNDYYGPLNNLLGLEGFAQLDTHDFGPSYHAKGKEISVIDLWNDLESWGFKNGTGVCYLPIALIENARYVDVPKYFGLLKASDMKYLPRLFAQLEEAGTLGAGQVPGLSAMVGIICDSPLSPRILSKACLSNLREARRLNDVAMVDAYGRLLCAKSRDFDGFSEEGADAAGQASARCRVGLLRVLDNNGRLRVVCRLRKDDAWERLPLEEGRNYAFEPVGTGGTPGNARWIASSPWFSLMNLGGITPPSGMRVRCEELSLSAQLLHRDIVVMRNWGLPFHLQGSWLEVNEVEPEMDYVFLAPGSTAPNLAGLVFSRLQLKVPTGLSCWKTRIPQHMGNWPAGLPPLIEDKPSEPSIRVDGFRLEPRSCCFALQFPPCVQSSHGTLEVFIKSSYPASLGAALSPGNGGWLLVALREGQVVLALRKMETREEIQGSAKEIHLVDIGQRSPCPCDDALITPGEAVAIAYPRASFHLEGGTLAPLVSPDPGTYLASDPPKLRVEVNAIPSDQVELLINGQPSGKIPVSTKSLLFRNKIGTFQLECRWRGIPLCQSRVNLRPDPQLHVHGLSADAQRPTEVSETVCARVWADWDEDAEVTVHYAVMDVDSVVKRGAINTPHVDVITCASEAGLEPDHTYRLRFEVANKVVATRWFKIRSRHGRNPLPPRGRAGGLNPLADAFENVVWPASGNGGCA